MASIAMLNTGIDFFGLRLNKTIIYLTEAMLGLTVRLIEYVEILLCLITVFLNLYSKFFQVLKTSWS